MNSTSDEDDSGDDVYTIELNPQPAVNSFEVSPFSPAFYLACNWAC